MPHKIISENMNPPCHRALHTYTSPLANGFAFAMRCKGVKTILTFRFAKDLVSSTIETLIVDAPKYSSSILTMMRRVGDCPGHTPGKAL